MRKVLFIFVLALSVSVYGGGHDSLKIINLQKDVMSLKVINSHLQQENAAIRGLYKEQKTFIDSLLNRQKKQEESLNTLANKIGADLSETNKNLEESKNSLSSSINNRTWWAVCGTLIVLTLLGVVYFILRKKIRSGSSSIDKIKAAQEGLETAQKALEEESVKLDNKLVELLDKQVSAQPQSSSNDDQPDHSLALKVADEIVRIETNLSRMDESVKGYKQLKKAVERIRTNFLANGYEIVEMLGKSYNEGMKVSVNFETDESLKEGEQIITGIIKPQINYKGKMIQTAQITVSQNL